MENVNRSTRKSATLIEKLAVLLGLVIFALALLAGIVAGVFVATGAVSETELRWWATILTVVYLPSIIIIWHVAKREAKEHLKGFARGLDGAQLTLTSLGRGLSATASMARTARPLAQPGYTVNLPNVPRTMPIITHRELASGDHAAEDL